MSKIYCVEDDESIRELILYALKTGGYEAQGFAEGEAFFRALAADPPALALLDIMLPGQDGLAILARIKSNPAWAGVAVMMLTAKTTELDKVRGLDAGADDYIAKPFGVMELLSRVRAVLRRVRPGREGRERLSCGPIAIDYAARTVRCGDVPVSLTFKEFELLYYLVANKGLALPRERIMERVWGYEFEGESRTVDMHIKTLRQKLEHAGVSGLIQTVRNVGYKITE